MFEAEYPIASLRPADYNPRKISDESLAHLVTSLQSVGIIKPIVALRDGLIIAGHQRTKASQLAGFAHTPVCFLSKKPNAQDEIRFNQLHNGTDLDSGEEDAWVEAASGTGFAMVDLVKGEYRGQGAVTRAELARMLSAYGNCGGCVAALSGEVLSGASYALAASILGMKVRTYFVPDDQIATVREIFGRAYGQYNYDAISRQTYNQTFAQMYRLRGGKRENASPTYQWLLATVPRSERILDFGCGQGDYVRKLKLQGYDIQGMEFFRRKGNALDYGAIHGMIDALIASVKTKGLWDVVICDYVLNSVDSQQAEDDVMGCVNAFLKPGGRAFFSGRPVERVETAGRAKMVADDTRYVEFLDENNMTGLFRAGEWFFQKFHSRAQIYSIVRTHFRDDGKVEL